jgi:foldase protein PrsA
MATKKKTTPKKVINNTKRLNLPLKDQRFLIQILLVVAVGVLVFFLAKKYRRFFLAGTVNTTPISRWQLNQRLVDQYGEQVLEEMVNEAILKDLASKSGVEVSDQDISDERNKIIEQVGGQEAFDQALVQYGLTLDSLNDRLRITLTQEKLAEKNISVEVSDEEVQQEFKTNASFYEGKTLEEASGEIRDVLLEQKLQQEFAAWFDQQRQAAQINLYI